jgi:hypothetical protein
MKVLNGILTGAIVTLISVTYANASTGLAITGLEGKYKYLESKCSSGTPVQMPAGTHASISGNLTVTSDEETLEIHSVVTFDDVPGSPLRQQLDFLEKAKAYVQQLPDSPEKQKQLAEILNAEATIQKYFREGVTCNTQSKASYTVIGNTVRTTDGVSTSDCAGAENGPVPSDESTFEISGNLLKIFSPVGKDEACPAGDSTVTIFERQN